MKLLQKSALLLVALVVAVPTLSFARPAAAHGQTDGTFAGIEQGDYGHFLVKTGAGKQESFFILRPDKSVQAFLDHPDKLKGRKVRVHWEERDENIPEAGGRQRIKVVTKVDART